MISEMDYSKCMSVKLYKHLSCLLSRNDAQIEQRSKEEIGKHTYLPNIV